jgi:membrane protein DedA with SNARE-associated domain
VPIVTAGVLSHQGVMRWWLALPVCIAGVLAGDVVLYWAGRHWGVRVLDHPLLGRFLDRPRLEQIEASYRRRGALIVFLSRHVIGLRAAAFFCAGVVGLPFWKFLAADGAAVGYGVPLNFALAYFFSRHLTAALAEVHRVERWLALALVLLAAIWVGVALRRRSLRALAAARLAPPPGPAGDARPSGIDSRGMGAP